MQNGLSYFPMYVLQPVVRAVAKCNYIWTNHTHWKWLTYFELGIYIFAILPNESTSPLNEVYGTNLPASSTHNLIDPKILAFFALNYHYTPFLELPCPLLPKSWATKISAFLRTQRTSCQKANSLQSRACAKESFNCSIHCVTVISFA